ncbi:complement factor H-like isoform X2 [Ornithodoros turicata]|uniref:complement factor H-like isoform X2 n=1 Tax=Ornithodoros turicata TaxID=34597 RepID=UPI0031394232
MLRIMTGCLKVRGCSMSRSSPVLFFLLLLTFSTNSVGCSRRDVSSDHDPQEANASTNLPLPLHDTLKVKCKHNMVPNYRTITCAVVDGRPEWFAGPDDHRVQVSEVACVARCPATVPQYLEVSDMEPSHAAFIDKAAGESVLNFCNKGFKSFGSYRCREADNETADWEKDDSVQPQCKALCPLRVPDNIQVPHMNPSHDAFYNKAAGESVIQFCKRGFGSLGRYNCKKIDDKKVGWEKDKEYPPHCKANSASAVHQQFLITLIVLLPWRVS